MKSTAISKYKGEKVSEVRQTQWAFQASKFIIDLTSLSQPVPVIHMQISISFVSLFKQSVLYSFNGESLTPLAHEMVTSKNTTYFFVHRNRNRKQGTRIHKLILSKE